MTEDPFFSARHVNCAIESIAASETLTIIAGAGVAKDRGSPDWSSLTQSLLRSLLNHSPKRMLHEHAEEIASTLAASLDPLRLASATRFLAEQQRLSESALDTLIKRDLDERAGPGGNLAYGIALLALIKKTRNSDVRIITTNYDNYLELAGRDEQLQALNIGSLVPVVSLGQPIEPADVPVYHLHGVVAGLGLPVGGADPPPVYCERDYAKMRGGWQEGILQDRLRKGTCLFIGTSLTDPYLAYCLNETLGTRGGDVFAVIPRQGESWLSEKIFVQGLSLAALSEVAGARLQHLGIKPLYCDYYSQVSQLCFELAHCVQQGEGSYKHGSPHRYGQRLSTWHSTWREGVERQTLAGHQLHGQSRLRELRDQIRRDIEGADAETFKLELWIRDHPRARRKLVLWSSSEAALLSEDAVHRAPIKHLSEYLAVRTFAQGHALGPDIPSGVSIGRWKTAISVPVWLDEPRWFHLPVGVIGLLSTGDNALQNLYPAQKANIAKAMAATAEQLLTP